MSGPKVSVKKIDSSKFTDDGVVSVHDKGSNYCYIIEGVMLDEKGVINVPALVKDIVVPGNNKKIPTIIFLSKEAVKNIRDIQSDTPVYLKVDGNVSLPNFKGKARVIGGPENNIFIGNANDDALYGGGGDDVLEGGVGDDTLVGANGVDTVSYSSSAVGVYVNLSAYKCFGGDAEGDFFLSIENITGSSFSDVLIGNGYDNTLTGNSGNDTLSGSGGSDNLYGGAGNDTYFIEGYYSLPGKVEIRDDQGASKLVFKHSGSDRLDLNIFDVKREGRNLRITKENENKKGNFVDATIVDFFKDENSNQFSFYTNYYGKENKYNLQKQGDNYKFLASK